MARSAKRAEEPGHRGRIGAADPIQYNNTYRLYRRSARGVLVEPNPTFAAKLRSARPGDVVLEAGIGTMDADSADFYIIGGSSDGTWNDYLSGSPAIRVGTLGWFSGLIWRKSSDSRDRDGGRAA